MMGDDDRERVHVAVRIDKEKSACAKRCTGRAVLPPMPDRAAAAKLCG
jgi:hypothetical protein